MRIFLLLMTVFILSGCSHGTLKAPCRATAALSAKPCAPIPVNLADSHMALKTRT